MVLGAEGQSSTYLQRQRIQIILWLGLLIKAQKTICIAWKPTAKKWVRTLAVEGAHGMHDI
jgi:hypothetical protein